MPNMTDFKPKKKANIDIPMDDEEVFCPKRAGCLSKPKPTAPAAKSPDPKACRRKKSSRKYPNRRAAVAVVKREYAFPPLELLKEPDPLSQADVKARYATTPQSLCTLMSFGTEAKIINITRGPTVSYEVRLPSGIGYSKLASLSDDLARLSAQTSAHNGRIGGHSSQQGHNIVRIREVISQKSLSKAVKSHLRLGKISPASRWW